ncbi:DUF3085 domain-containing protein [Caballeronia sp. LZ001]|uniref:DUF3085 domain-containing protein n=1 Tax=Caballeronia sp. LZ001 TaxID=3038553 RepID=UPI00285FBFB3|nr:DUF3085 domain-containing protein [Caballeronia sp. LZ001]MDR5804920.1 DUF3085 domain-containing protein [Caballeronia sp. LZ001]
MIRFLAADLHPVITEARNHDCDILLVKDQGVYMMSQKTDDQKEGQSRLVAYAVECNPDFLPFDDWWDRAKQEFGGDDFVEHLSHDDGVFTRVLKDGYDLQMSADEKHLYINAVPPTRR